MPIALDFRFSLQIRFLKLTLLQNLLYYLLVIRYGLLTDQDAAIVFWRFNLLEPCVVFDIRKGETLCGISIQNFLD